MPPIVEAEKLLPVYLSGMIVTPSEKYNFFFYPHTPHPAPYTLVFVNGKHLALIGLQFALLHLPTTIRNSCQFGGIVRDNE